MQRFQRTLPALVSDLTDEQWRFKPPSGNWSILEIVCHLRDEEAEDFRPRLQRTLAEPMQTWTSIDPVAAATERDYQGQDAEAALRQFLEERRASLQWLGSLGDDVDWQRAYQHPQFGAIPAGDLMSAWAAHDLLHLRQISKRLYEQAAAMAGRYSVAYAGKWQES